MSRRTPLRDVHEERGARFTEFGGWEMPVEFESIREEHAAVRDRAGLFDVSHMGEVEVRGPDAETLCQRLLTNDVTALTPGRSLYSMITNEDGVILDDTVIYRLSADGFLFVPNAGHDEEMYDRWVTHRDEWGLEAEVTNVTDEYAMIAVQGPDAEGLLAEVVPGTDGSRSVASLGRFETIEASVAGVDVVVSRTGYTGEDGFELLLAWDDAETVWRGFDCQPCGLGARDTLRLEMGFLLSGQEFHPVKNPRTPYEAAVGFTVALDAEPPFVGRDALARQRSSGVDDRLVGLRLLDRGVPRTGYDLTDGSDDGRAIGEVTSGTVSPTLGVPIGLGYVPVEYADPGTEVGVLIRGRTKRGRIEPTPFLEGKR